MKKIKNIYFIGIGGIGMSGIAEIMKKENTTSSDIIDRNICVLNNQIHIIDFGLANQFSESVDTSITKLYKILYKYGKNKKYIEYNL